MGLIATVVIGLLFLMNPKQGILFIIVYFPVRPFLIEVNDGLKYAGDFVVVLLFLQSLLYWFKNRQKFKKKVSLF